MIVCFDSLLKGSTIANLEPTIFVFLTPPDTSEVIASVMEVSHLRLEHLIGGPELGHGISSGPGHGPRQRISPGLNPTWPRARPGSGLGPSPGLDLEPRRPPCSPRLVSI